MTISPSRLVPSKQLTPTSFSKSKVLREAEALISQPAKPIMLAKPADKQQKVQESGLPGQASKQSTGQQSADNDAAPAYDARKMTFSNGVNMITELQSVRNAPLPDQFSSASSNFLNMPIYPNVFASGNMTSITTSVRTVNISQTGVSVNDPRYVSQATSNAGKDRPATGADHHT